MLDICIRVCKFSIVFVLIDKISENGALVFRVDKCYFWR